MEAVRRCKYAPKSLNDQPVPHQLERDGNVPAERVIRKRQPSRGCPIFVRNNLRWLIVIPIVGGMLVGIGGVAALMMAFEDVDEIERMKTFGLAATIGILFWIASVWIVTNGPRPIQQNLAARKRPTSLAQQWLQQIVAAPAGRSHPGAPPGPRRRVPNPTLD